MFDLSEYYRVYAGVDLDKIYMNMQNMRDCINAGSKLVAVVKADGYGHGAVPVAVTVDELVEAYAVATIDEALQLRKHGITKPIYLLGFIPDNKIETAILNEIRFAVFEYSQGEKISEVATALNKRAYVHIKLDTGMGRIGFLPNDKSIEDVIKVSKLNNITVEGIFTHFSKADEVDKTHTDKQIDTFEDFIKRLSEKGLNISIKHCSNSAGIIDIPRANMSEVRAGISMYGMYPSDDVNKRRITLYPALELKSHIIYIKEVEKGCSIGYGGTYITEKPTKVATIPVGYGDGYPRNLSNKGSVIINGKRASIIGRVCMDQFMVDVTDIEGVKEGDVVTLVGQDGDQCITVEEVAALAGTFNYEFVCDLGKRIPRVYYRGGEIISTKDYNNDEYCMKL